MQPGRLPFALPLLLAWALAPEIAYRIGQPLRHTPEPLTAEQNAALRSLARRTWLFFEDFVGPDDHWLPPDHFQETPHGSVAPYTSPTNIGLLLLSTLAAYDLGYIGIAALVVPPAFDLREPGAPGALPGALPELVRHAHPGAPAAALCFYG